MSVTLIKKFQIENLGIISTDIAANANILTTQLADGVNFIKRNGSVAFTANQSMGGFKLTDLAEPTSQNDAARLIDIQNAKLGIFGKEAVKLATTANISLNGLQIIDGISTVAGDRILVKNQTDPTQNGIYIASTTAWTRSIDANTSTLLKSGVFTFVNEGTLNSDSGWLISTDGDIVIGTTNVLWVQFTGAGQINAGAGLSKVGNTLSAISVNTNRIIVSVSGIDLATTGVTPGTYSKLTVDTYGRITVGAALTPGDIGAQINSNLLTAISNLSGNGFIVKTGVATVINREITGTAGLITITNGDAIGANPNISLSNSGVAAGNYNGFTVDIYGRITSAVDTENIVLANYLVREQLTGTINGVNATFTIGYTPKPGKESIFRNGQLLNPGVGNDYTISGTTITLAYPAQVGELLLATYLK